jgi:hypothetical protein
MKRCIGAIENGWDGGLMTAPKRAMNYVDTLGHACSTWVRQFLRCAISCVIAMFKLLNSGTLIGFKTGNCVQLV